MVRPQTARAHANGATPAAPVHLDQLTGTLQQLSQSLSSLERRMSASEELAHKQMSVLDQLVAASPASTPRATRAASPATSPPVKHAPTKDEHVAIIGYSCILPGGENAVEAWEMVQAGIDNITDIPPDRVDVSAYFHPDKNTPDKIYCTRGGFIPPFEFDPREYNFNMLQMEDTDTNQTLSLLKVKEALEDANIDTSPATKKNIGCVLGIGGGQKASNEFYSRLNYVVVDKVLRQMGVPEKDVEVAVEKYKAHFPQWRLDSFPGFLGNVTAGRVCNVFNLDGMNCVVDAACASSLISVKVAIEELLHGDCETMLAGATCTDCSIGMYMAFSKTPVFSTKPQVTAYDKDAKGMLIGEGSVIYVLKRLQSAVRDGDRIHAVIRSCSSSSDGKAPGIYAPTVEGQELAIRRAHQHAGIDASSVTLVEGHGTGTPVGDAIELTALKNVLGEGDSRRERVAVGSIKSNIGHLKAVAGAAGMLKVVMALKHKILPKTINVKEPPVLRDGSRIQDTAIYINTRNRPWFTTPGVPRRAGVSSFGFGGSNYHCILEEYEPEHTAPYRVHATPDLVLLAAPSVAQMTKACDAALAELSAAVAKADASDDKSAFSFAAKQMEHVYYKFATANKMRGGIPASHPRVGFVCSSPRAAVAILEAVASRLRSHPQQPSWTLPKHGAHFRASGMTTTGKVAALFSGQGSQYTYMFDDTAMNWPPMRTAISQMDQASLKARPAGCPLVSETLYPRQHYESEPEPEHNSFMQETLHSQPCTTAVAVGAFDIFSQAGFQPDFVAGHSLGEIAALYAGGVIERETAFELVCHRATAMSDACKAAKDEAMAAVIGPNASALKIAGANVWLANINDPSQVVISGSKAAVAAESEKLIKSGFRVVPLKVSGAFHTPLMKTAAATFEKHVRAASATFKPSKSRVYSNVTGGHAYNGDASASADLLSKHITSSVRWIEEVQAMHRDGARVFVEFGPRPTLSKFVEKIVQGDDVFVVSVNPSKEKSSDMQLREAAVQLGVIGVPISNFDPWPVINTYKLGKNPELPPVAKSKGTMKLTAATFVAPRTKRAREEAMNDGYKISGNVMANIVPSDADIKSKEYEMQKLKTEAEEAKKEVESLRKAIAAAEARAEAARAEMRSVKQGMQVTAAQTAQAKPAKVYTAAPVSQKTGGVSAEHATKVVLDVLAAKTGYEPEMIEMDMNLETELGVDSIKRVEILSEVQKELNVEAQNVAALSRTQTVGEVVEAMIKELGGVQHSPAPMATAAPGALPTSTSTTAATGNVSAEHATKVVLDVLAAKTGYEPEMIEMDMNLETELGVDSIKRVEILSEVQKELSVEAQNVAALSRTQTVGEVVEAMIKELGGIRPSSVPAPKTAPAAAPTPAAPTGGVSAEHATKVVLDVLAAKTGYEPEMIEMDMNLETELGVDSIKRVEILSEVQKELNVEAQNVAALSRTQTVGEVVEAMIKELGGAKPASAPVAPVAKAAPATAPTPAAPTGGVSAEHATKVVLDVLAAKTGYEPEMIEMDMNLETELGVDSIKRVEILSEVQKELNVEAQNVAALSRTQTVGEVVEAMIKELGGAKPASAPVAPVAKAAPAVAPTPAAPTGGVSAEHATKVVLDVLAAKTGYEPEMIEMDMNLETELGVDSIKRVEILSEVQKELNVEAQNVAALSRTQTVGEVVEAMIKELGGAKPASAPAAPVAKAAPATAPTPAAPTGGVSAEHATKVVLDVLAAKTGYEPEMIEMDMNLETELGVDSIKRVEILSEVQKELNVEAQNVAALSRTQTVGEVVEAMIKELGGAKPASAPVAPVAKAAPATASTPAAPTGGVSAEHATKVVLDVLAAKTGYEPEMIEMDMNLETELGVDSIKRVEILSEVQKELNVEAQNVAALSRTQTVGEVVEAMIKELGGAKPASAPVAPVAKAAPATASTPAAPTGGVSAEHATKVVLDVLAAKTGYEPEMIEMDMNLETELGVDSIKRVEILSEVQKELNVEAQNVAALSRTQTVGEVVEAMIKELGGAKPASAPVAPVAKAAPATAPTPAAPTGGVSAEHATKVVLDVLAAKTGYEPEMIEMDMNLETELGVDSIKRVEILSEVQKELNVEAQNVAALSRTQTVGEVVEAMIKELGGAKPASAPVAPVAKAAPAVAPTPAAPTGGVSAEHATKVVLDVLAAKTGYEPEMIEMDMNLETELGVDSIKRVEILSEVQKELNVEAQNVAALSRTQTVGEVVEAMIKELGGAKPASAPVAPVAKAAPAVASTPAAPTGGVSAEHATKVVLDVLAAKTGYEPEMIEMDMNLETELGVDSIKRVEILSEVQKELNVEAQNVAALSRTQTVGEVVEAMIKELGGAKPASAPVAKAAPAASTPAAPTGGVSAEHATKVVLDVLAAKTGYEPEMIEMDMNLETELGVDSIKRVEILSEVQKELNVEAQNVAALSRTQTVGEVVEAMIKELGM